LSWPMLSRADSAVGAENSSWRYPRVSQLATACHRSPSRVI
jgi:hypothetical protein